MILLDPYNSLNLFPPSNAAAQNNVILPTATTEEIAPSPTTADAAPSPTTASAAAPTATTIVINQPTATTQILPTPTDFIFSDATATIPAVGKPLYVVQEGTPVYIAAPNCDGLYVAGQVFDKNGGPVVLIWIQLGGVLNDEPLYEEEALSGSATQWGQSGYEIKITENMANSIGEVYVQVYDQNSEDIVSELIFFNTFDDCDRNLVLINWVEVEQ